VSFTNSDLQHRVGVHVVDLCHLPFLQ